MVIPTLAADSRLLECVESLARQTRRDFEVIIVDNSGKGLVRRNGVARPAPRVIENERNAGFGAAINQGLRASTAPYLATLNDDAVAHPRWLEALVAALERRPDAGMCASQVRLFGEHRLDSAGMLVARDGSSKQRGHGRPPEDFPVARRGAVAQRLGGALPPRHAGGDRRLRRRFLSLLRGHRSRACARAGPAGSACTCRTPWWSITTRIPRARASPLKAYYVERNRLFVLAKNFPAGMLAAAPFVSLARYCGTRGICSQGRGSAARFRAEGNAGPRMAWYVLRAHARAARHMPRACWRQRREIRARARITPAHLPASAAQPLHQRQEGGGALIRAARSRLACWSSCPPATRKAPIGGVVALDPRARARRARCW